MPEKLDQWHDFRKSVALVSMVLFFFCLLALGNVVYQVAIAGDERGVFDPWSFLGFLSVAVPLGVAAVTGLRVYRATNNAESKRRGRIMGLALLAAAVLLVVTGVIGDLLS
ncbi:hypothetical protein [Micromonospora zamorensis]|uniref:hypothetical protein n=2 Tax=Micromonospora TaxID=1873 RepID=UPI001B3958A2|nr:hypothetical protein [Micromonospora sp. M61]MBQ1035636.1 hypothetical protein [Micromonospora sp. C81]WTI20695.1 hypothetical protein OG886_27895 [Micromonospora zamorensis]